MKTKETQKVILDKQSHDLVNKERSETLFQELVDDYRHVKNLNEDCRITKEILLHIKEYGVSDDQIKLFLPGITTRMEDDRSEIRDNAFIVCSCLFKDNVFKIQSFKNYNLYEDIITVIFGQKLDVLNLSTVEKIDKTVILPTKNDIKYLQQAIEILNNNETQKFELVYKKLCHLIFNASDRTLQRADEFLKPIVISEHDTFEKVRAVALLIERNSTLLDLVINEIFENNYNVKDKIVLIISLIVFVQNGNNARASHIIKEIEGLRSGVNLHKVLERYLDMLIEKLKNVL